MGKWAKYNKKYNANWERESWAQGWLIENFDVNNINKVAYCKICKVALRAHKADLQKHASTVHHKQKFQCVNPPQCQRKLPVVIIKNEEKEVELFLAAYIAMHSSIRSIDHLGEILKVHGKKSPLENLQLHRTKCSALLKYVISPVLLEELQSRLIDVPFSLIVDESTDCSVIKYLCICVKYFDASQEEIITEFLSILEVECVTADNLFAVVKSFIVNLGLKLAQLVGIGTDGASNLCGVNHSLFTLLQEECPNLQLVRCICHSLDNAASHAAQELPAAVDFLCREIYNWFSRSSDRKIHYRRLFDILNDSQKTFINFVQLSTTRWLSRFRAVDTIIQHWDELKHHFNIVVGKEKCYTARLLKDMLNDHSNFLSLIMVRPVLYLVNNLNILFQKNDVDMGATYKDVCNVIRNLGLKIMKPIFTCDVNTIIKNVDNPLAYVAPEDADFGIEYIRETRKLKIQDCEKQVLYDKGFMFIKTMLKEIVNRLPNNLKLMKNISFFSPEVCLNPVLRAKFSDLPFLKCIDNGNLFTLESEYNSLLEINWQQSYGDGVLKNSLTFWPCVLKHKNAGGQPAFENIAKFVLKILTLPSSNAVVERVFSIMNTVKSKLRNKMQTQMLEALLRIRVDNYARKKCCKDFKVTRRMLERFNSKEMYGCNNSISNNNTINDCDIEILEAFQAIECPCISLTDE